MAYYIFIDKNGKEIKRQPIRGRLRKDALPFLWGNYSIVCLENKKRKYVKKVVKNKSLEELADKAVEEAKRIAGVYDN